MLEFICGPLQELGSFTVWGDIMIPPSFNYGPLGLKPLREKSSGNIDATVDVCYHAAGVLQASAVSLTNQLCHYF